METDISQQILQTDFYIIIPLPYNMYTFVIDNSVVGIYKFSSLESAEDFLIQNYYKLKNSNFYT